MDNLKNTTMNIQERQGDLILSQGTFVFVQDGASGQVEVIMGPHKVSLADTDKPVIYDPKTRLFIKVNAADAVETFPAANEEQYIVLFNPVKDNQTQKHPSKGKQQSVDLNIGNKIHINGPQSFALYPGQYAEVINGHQLKSNEYLLVRVYNEEAAKLNYDKAIVKKSTEETQNFSIKKENLVTGSLFIIKGTEVSFYIPPTGIEVLAQAAGEYVRNAVTLERLEYCILLDQNGDKRYVEGPAVVFPKPTEVFVNMNGNNKFKAIELNDNMGIYVKVIADYKENDKTYKAGEEMFITGKEQKIYFPRPEHAIIKYGSAMMHYASAVPAGEGRYVLDKNTGEINLVVGPMMLLPDPRNQVIVKRILNSRTVELWFPGNKEAMEYNKKMQEQQQEILPLIIEQNANKNLSKVSFGAISDEMQRSEKFTKPRTITLDNRFDGAVSINVWPGFAIQVVKKNGIRELVEGPCVRLLEYDEELDVMELSTGKPKTDKITMRAVYLQTENNIVSDIIEVETKDSVKAMVKIAYRVNFVKEHSKKWFNVPNYVKLLTQHTCSLVRNAVKKTPVEEFNASGVDIIREIILGKTSEEGKRPGRLFPENGMFIYDVEVLDISLGDDEIAELLKQAQHDAVQNNLDLIRKEQMLEYVKKSETLLQAELQEKAKTSEIKAVITLKEIEENAKAALLKLKGQENQQSLLDLIKNAELARREKESELDTKTQTELAELEIRKIKESMNAISPGLIEAMTSLGTVSLSEILAKNLKIQTGGLGGIFPKGGIEGVLETIKDTPLERSLTKMLGTKNGKLEE
jgi:major vault protein